MKATWNKETIAESDDTVVVEGNHYFPLSSIKKGCFKDSGSHTTCPWKGVASYFHITVGGATNEDAAWFYPEPKPEAMQVKDRVAFWKGVEVKAD